MCSGQGLLLHYFAGCPHLGDCEIPEFHLKMVYIDPLGSCYNLQPLSVREGLFAGVMQQLAHLGTLVAKNSIPEQHSGPISSCVTPRIRCNHSTICLMMLQSPTIISQGRIICRSDAATITHVFIDRQMYILLDDG